LPFAYVGMYPHVADSVEGQSKVGKKMTPCRKDINTFMVICERLLGHDVVVADLTDTEARVIQYYISALAEKFPSLINDPPRPSDDL
jgi:hypothetical protein